MVEQLKAQIKTKTLEAGGGGGPNTPLRHFKGKPVSWEPFMQSGTNRNDNTQYNRIVVRLSFSELEVLRAQSPYDHPIGTIEVPFSGRQNSRWGIFAASAEQFIPDELPPEYGEDEDSPKQRLDWLTENASRIEIEYEEGHMLFDWRQQKETPQEAWVIKSVEGAVFGGVAAGSTADNKGVASVQSASDIAKDTLNGKTLQEFNAEVMQNQVVRQDTNIMMEIVNGTLASSLVASGEFTVDNDGKYHRAS